MNATEKILAYLALALLGAIANAKDMSVKQLTLSIEAQPMVSALSGWATQTGLQLIVHDGTAINRLIAPCIRGQFAPQVALNMLLEGTPLTFEFVNEWTVVIRERVPAARPQFSSMDGRQAGKQFLYLSAAYSDVPHVSNDARSTATRASENTRLRGGLEEVIVTAQKRSERLIDVPQSVSVLSGEDLSRTGAVQFRDFANSVPGLSFTTNGAGRDKVSLRGVTTFTPSRTVAIYVDEVAYGSSSPFAFGNNFALDVGLFDIDRLEVLRGPQGTLYGASAMGGLIKYVTKRPDATAFGGDAQLGLSSTREGGVSYNGAATINAPIVDDKVAVRASGFYSRDGGYIDNVALGDEDVNLSNVYGGRADLLFTPSEALAVRITGFAQNIARDGEGTTDYAVSGASLDGALDQHRMIAEPFDQQFRLLSGTITYDLDWASLTSISSYQTSQSSGLIDFSSLYVPLLDAFFGRSYSAVGYSNNTETEKFVQEVRLSADGGQPFEWVIGAFYTDETSERKKEEFVLRDLAGQPAPNDLFTFSIPSTYEEYAAFGDLTWHLTDKFDVSGGIRHARNHQTFEQIGSGLLIGSTPFRRSNESVSTYLANTRYHFTDHSTGYLRYATGYRPGGPNIVVNDPTTGLPIGPESFEADKLKSYEVGFKAETGDQRFGVDVAAYHIDWDNIQVLVSRGGGSFSGYGNAPGGARVRGAELVLTARAATSLTLMGTVAYQDAEMLEADADLGAAQGERLPDVPRLTAALNADYELPVGNLLRPMLGVTVRFVDDRTAGFSGSGFNYRLPDYTTVDLRAGFELNQVRVQMFIRNLSDERGQLSAFNGYGSAHAAILQPRTIGVTAITRF